MSFTGREGEAITLQTATQWAANYRNSAPSGAIHSHFFGRDIINTILNQSGCVGIRAYYAIDDKGIQQILLVGVNANQEDLYNGTIADRSILCPPYCPTNSPLNG